MDKTSLESKPKTKGKHPGGPFRKGNTISVGNSGGGRPKRKVEDAYLEVIFGACPLDKWKQVCERAVTDAIHGDEKVVAKARDFLAKYLAPICEAQGTDPNAAVNAVLTAIANKYLEGGATN